MTESGHSGGRRVRAALVVAGLIGMAVWISTIPGRDLKRFGVVDESRVYRSGEPTASALARAVEQHGIRTIIDLGAWEPGSAGERRAEATAKALGLTRFRFDLEGDSTGDPNNYVAALRLMTDPEHQPVLVHCGAGSERTGMAVMLYRHLVQGWRFSDAFDEARRFDHDPGRNVELTRMMLDWAPEIERAFRDGGTIAIADPSAPEPGS